MRYLWNKRRLASFGVLAAMVGVMLWMVLPALAGSPGGTAGFTSGDLVSPTYSTTGGQPNDCVLFSAPGTDQYLVKNPKSIDQQQQTVIDSNGVTVTFLVTLHPNNTLDFTVGGAIVTDVGIDGGSGTDHYSYAGKTGGGVTHDTGLSAPLQSDGSPYSLSQTTFCYTPISCQPGVPFGSPSVPGYTIEVPSCSGKDAVSYDFGTSTSGGQTVVTLHTEGASTTQTPMVENIVGTLGSPSQTTLRYTDIYPFNPSNLHDMRLCQVDPRAGGSDPQQLAPAYQSASSSSSVLQPADATIDPESTSCLIAMSTSVDASGVVHFHAYVYSLVDGQRVF